MDNSLDERLRLLEERVSDRDFALSLLTFTLDAARNSPRAIRYKREPQVLHVEDESIGRPVISDEHVHFFRDSVEVTLPVDPLRITGRLVNFKL